MGGDWARRGADFLEQEGERMEGGILLVLDGVLEAMVLESVDLLVLGSGRSLLGREGESVPLTVFRKYVYHSDNNTVSTHLMERGGCRGQCDHTH